MRLITTILLFITFEANANIYYVSNTGSDLANGTSTGTAWQTIAKVNASSFSAGDQILFKKGDTWNEQLIPPSSGTSGNVITFGSYGTGNAPIITGFQTLSGWANVGNIWSSTFTNSVPYQNTVMVNDVWAAKGRYPNYGHLLYTLIGSSKTQVKGLTLTGTPNYVGAEIAIAENNFIIETKKITAQATDTLAFSSLFYQPVNGFRFTIQNIESVLDTLNEWCYDSATKVLKVYATTQPTVKASSIDTLVKIYRKNYITFDGISFTGGNRALIYLDSTLHVTVQNCTIQYGGGNGFWSYPRSDYSSLISNTVSDIWNTGVMNDGFSNGVTPNGGRNFYMYRNTVRRCGVAFGMGKDIFQAYIGVYSDGRNAIIQENTVDSTGYIGVEFLSDSCLIYRNTVSNFLVNKNDGAGIYSWAGRFGYTSRGSRIKNNIVHTPRGTVLRENIYLDEGCSYVDVDSNTVYGNPQDAGIYLHIVNHINVRYNRIYGCLNGINNQQSPRFNSYIVGNHIYASAYTYNFYPFNSMVGYVDSLAVLGTIDSNYYSRPVNESNLIGYNSTMYSLATWRSFSGRDLNSGLTPTGITADAPLLKTNTTLSTASLPLSGTYRDITGRVYFNSITLQPYESAILFRSSTQVVIPGRIKSLIFTQ